MLGDLTATKATDDTQIGGGRPGGVRGRRNNSTSRLRRRLPQCPCAPHDVAGVIGSRADVGFIPELESAVPMVHGQVGLLD